MRIQLLIPPAHHYASSRYRMNPSMALPILAAVLERAGHETAVYDLEALGLTPDDLEQRFALQRTAWPDAVGMTVSSYNARGARECVAALRAAGYDRHIVLGGPEVTRLVRDNGDEQSAWGADCWVVGECEGNVAEVFERRMVGLVEGVPAPIESIPAPLWTKHRPAPTTYYGNPPLPERPQGIAMWSRGCPHDCAFCANIVYKRQRVRRRPPERVFEDMAALKALGMKSVFVYDDELVGHAGGDDWLRECCRLVAPLGLVWQCQGRCSERHVHEDTLRAMREAGCRVVMWGVESFSERVLDASHKATSEADIWHTLRASKAAGLDNWLFLMVGNYRETVADLAYTLKKLKEAIAEGLVDYRQVTVTTPMPGTQLYHLAKAEGWLVEPPESGPQMHQVYNATPWLSEREIRYWAVQLESA